MDYQCSKKFYVGYSDVDSNDKCRLSRILDFCQNIATIHSDGIGYGTKGMMDRGWAWLVTSMKIKIKKYPIADKEIECRTWSRGIKGILAKRDYELLDENGEIIIIGDSSWALFDLKEQKLMRAPQEMLDAYQKIDRSVFGGEELAKIRDNNIVEIEKEFVIGKRDIDTNHHMNNARYLDYVSEVLPDGYIVNELECTFKKQIRYMEKINVSYGDNYARIKNEAGDTCFIVKFN